MLGSLIRYLKGMRIMMFQLSGFYCRRARITIRGPGAEVFPSRPRRFPGLQHLVRKGVFEVGTIGFRRKEYPKKAEKGLPMFGTHFRILSVWTLYEI